MSSTESLLLHSNSRRQQQQITGRANNNGTATTTTFQPAATHFTWLYDNISIVAGPASALLVYSIFLTSQDDTREQMETTQRLASMFAILLWVCVWWLTEAVPVAITALLPMFLFPLLQITSADEVAKAYMNDTISLFIGSFILALAVQKYNCHKRLALKTLLAFGGEKMDPRFVLLGFCAGPAFVSMFISNTATAIMMIPMAVGVVHKVQNSKQAVSAEDPQQSAHLEESMRVPSKSDEESISSGLLHNGFEQSSPVAAKILSQYSKGVVLAVAYAVAVGGMSTLTGTGPNLVFSGIFRSIFPDAPPVTYTQWFMFGFPLGFLFLILLWLMLCIMYCPPAAVPVVSASLNRSVIQKEYDALGAMEFAEKAVLAIFSVLALLWMTRATNRDVPGWGDYFHGYADDGTVSVMMATLVFILPNKKEVGKKLMNWGDCKKLPWDIVLVLGGGFALAQGIRDSGLSEWIAAHLYFLHTIPYVLITPFVAIIVSITTEFTSNNATATIFLPLLAEVSLSLNIHPLFLMVTATMSASLAFMLPIATPPNAVAFTAGNLHMTELAIPGFMLKCIGIVLLSVFMPTLGVSVFGLNTHIQD